MMFCTVRLNPISEPSSQGSENRPHMSTNCRDYLERINEDLRPKAGGPLVLDLFAGCGGLALGFESLGFETVGYEMVASAAQTYEANLRGSCHKITLTPDYLFPPAEVVIGGPPCQPFSVGGHQLGLKDARDGFPTFVSAVRQSRPAVWMFENVRGLLYRNRWYLDQVIEELEALGYRTHAALYNAVDFGVPQSRERVIVFGSKVPFVPPSGSPHRTTAGEALQALASEAPADGKYLTSSMDAYVKKYELASKCINPRDLHLSRPARTLTCRNLAGATGDMHRILLPDGRRRRLTVREAARLQSFPDWFEFCGGEGSQFEQVGNAVAPLFARALAQSVLSALEGKVNAELPSRPRIAKQLAMDLSA
jgi:DNA (cytosine-5)-methyltransferase 1